MAQGFGCRVQGLWTRSTRSLDTSGQTDSIWAEEFMMDRQVFGLSLLML